MNWWWKVVQFQNPTSFVTVCQFCLLICMWTPNSCLQTDARYEILKRLVICLEYTKLCYTSNERSYICIADSVEFSSTEKCGGKLGIRYKGQWEYVCGKLTEADTKKVCDVLKCNDNQELLDEQKIAKEIKVKFDCPKPISRLFNAWTISKKIHAVKDLLKSNVKVKKTQMQCTLKCPYYGFSFKWAFMQCVTQL